MTFDSLAHKVHQRLCGADDAQVVPDPLAALQRIARDCGQQSPALSLQLERALRRLPPVHMAVLIAHKRDGLSHEQVAQKVGLTTKSVVAILVESKTILRTLVWEQQS